MAGKDGEKRKKTFSSAMDNNVTLYTVLAVNDSQMVHRVSCHEL